MKDVDGNNLNLNDLIQWRSVVADEFGFDKLGIIISSQYGTWIDIEDVRSKIRMGKYISNIRKASPEIHMLWKMENL